MVPKLIISADEAAVATVVKLIGGSMLDAIFPFASNPAIPFAAFNKTKSALALSATLVKVETGLFRSLVLFTLPNPTLFLSIMMSPTCAFTEVTGLFKILGLLTKSL